MLLLMMAAMMTRRAVSIPRGLGQKGVGRRRFPVFGPVVCGLSSVAVQIWIDRSSGLAVQYNGAIVSINFFYRFLTVFGQVMWFLELADVGLKKVK